MTEPADELREALAEELYGMPYGSVPRHRVAAFDALVTAVAAWAEQHARERAAMELLAAAEELHVARFNADEAPEARWPAGAPRVAPDTFYRGVTVAELALKYRANALALTRPDGGCRA